MLFSQELHSLTTIEETKIFLQNYFNKIKKEKNHVLREMFQAWNESKKIGLIKEAEDFLELIVEVSIKEKRLWALRDIQKNINTRNKNYKKIEVALRDLSGREYDSKKEVLVNPLNEITRRDLKNLKYFISWIEEFFKPNCYESFRTLYQGILLHGANEKILKIVKKTLSVNKKNMSQVNTKNDSDSLLSAVTKLDKVTITESEIINLNLIDDFVLQKHSNDILFSLLCLEDYKSIYGLEERLELSLKNNTKKFLEYYFYKYSSLLAEKKFKKLKMEIEFLIFELPLTKKEMLPFLFLYAEALMGTENYEEALNYLLILKNESLFENRATMRINEIKKN